MYYTRAIESGDLPHPDLFFAFNNRGNVYASKRDYDRAIRDYTEALRLNPKYAAAFRNRGRALVYKGDYDRAIADYNEAARLDPEDPHALIGRGIAYNAKHQYDLALRDFDPALRVCPACPLAVLNRAAAYVGKGDDGRAIQEFDVALKQSPGDPNVYGVLGGGHARARARSCAVCRPAHRAGPDSRGILLSGRARASPGRRRGGAATVRCGRRPGGEGRRAQEAQRVCGRDGRAAATAALGSGSRPRQSVNPRPREVTLEAHRRGAPRRLHDGEADGVRVIDGPASQPFEPEPRSSVMLGGGELDDREGARLEPVQRARRRPCARPEEQEPVHLGEDQVRGDQTDALRRRAAKHRVRFSVVTVARAQQRNPGAAIDEQPVGRAASGPGAGPISPQRTPPGGTDRTARCSLAGVHRSSRSAPARDPRRPGG